ncbi:MAG TPA: hypothetical protein VE643_06190 [Nitrososphaeraceae archaeon]|nr:hypothetical protein [Nitrososphaeraceae archaeon]
MTIRFLNAFALVVTTIVTVSLLLTLVVNRQSMPYLPVRPSNFDNHVGNDAGAQQYAYSNRYEKSQIVSKENPATEVAPQSSPIYAQTKQRADKVFNTHATTTELFNSTDIISTKIYKQIKSVLDIPLNTLTNLDVRLASDREKVYAKLALNKEIKSQVENLMMKDLMLPNTNPVAN